jgi:hypothetical protein
MAVLGRPKQRKASPILAPLFQQQQQQQQQQQVISGRCSMQ